jgi:hypothetical protein
VPKPHQIALNPEHIEIEAEAVRPHDGAKLGIDRYPTQVG